MTNAVRVGAEKLIAVSKLQIKCLVSNTCEFRLARRGDEIVREKRFGDNGRAEVRRPSVLEALALLEELARARN